MCLYFQNFTMIFPVFTCIKISIILSKLYSHLENVQRDTGCWELQIHDQFSKMSQFPVDVKRLEVNPQLSLYLVATRSRIHIQRVCVLLLRSIH